jgi:hypothetical protein
MDGAGKTTHNSLLSSKIHTCKQVASMVKNNIDLDKAPFTVEYKDWYDWEIVGGMTVLHFQEIEKYLKVINFYDFRYDVKKSPKVDHLKFEETMFNKLVYFDSAVIRSDDVDKTIKCYGALLESAHFHQLESLLDKEVYVTDGIKTVSLYDRKLIKIQLEFNETVAKAAREISSLADLFNNQGYIIGWNKVVITKKTDVVCKNHNRTLHIDKSVSGRFKSDSDLKIAFKKVIRLTFSKMSQEAKDYFKNNLSIKYKNDEFVNFMYC